MRRLLACLLVAAVVPGAAVGATSTTGIVPEDQARAKAMNLRKSDFLPGFVARKVTSDGGDLGKLRCPGIESNDVRATGHASTPNFTRGPVFVRSIASVYGTPADADAVWRDVGSTAGRECIAKIFRRAFEQPDTRLVSFRKVPFPRIAARALAFRAVAKYKTVPVYLDIVMLKHSRAGVILTAGGALVPLQRGDLVQFARILAGRMTTAMRGA